MVNDVPGNNLLKRLTLTGRPGEQLSLKVGTVLRAEVISITEKGDPLLSLTLPGSDKLKMFEALIKHGPDFHFSKGQELVLEVTRGGKNIAVKVISVSGGKTGNSQAPQAGAVPGTAVKPAVAAAGRPAASEPVSLFNMLRQAPGGKAMGNAAWRPVTLVSGSGGQVRLPEGAVFKALVTGLAKEGNVILRLNPSPGVREGGTLTPKVPAAGKGGVEVRIVKTDAALTLKKGQNVFIRIIGGGTDTRAELLESFSGPSGVRQDIPLQFLEMMANMPEARMSNPELKLFLNMIKSFPKSVKEEMPEIRFIEKTVENIKQLNSGALKRLVSRSGVAFETGLKASALKASGPASGGPAETSPQGDLKGLLLRLKMLLNREGMVRELEKAGFETKELSALVDRFINNIEYYQFASRLNDLFYTFLPVFFNGFRECEFLFGKGKEKGRVSYTCDINLELESLGRLSVSISIIDRAFYITFFTEKEGVEELINSRARDLKERFSSRGLLLKTLNVARKEEIVFGRTQYRGVSRRV